MKKADVTNEKPNSIMNTGKQWYAIYTRPRWEKKVNELLEKKGIQSYCPLNRVKRKWTDRTKIIYQPLIPSYVFVCITEPEKTKVRMTDGVVNFVYWLGKPAVIREQEIELIQRFLGDYENIEARQVDVVEGQRVRILSGVLTNKEGFVVRIEHNRAYVYIESLGVELTAQFEKKNLEAV